MPRLPATPRLSNRRYATIILRLQLDQDGRLIRGELVDADGTRQQHFIGWHGLSQSVWGWLYRQQHKRPPDA